MINFFKEKKTELKFNDFNKVKKITYSKYKYKKNLFLIFKLNKNFLIENNSYMPQLSTINRELYDILYLDKNIEAYFSIAETLINKKIEYFILINIKNIKNEGPILNKLEIYLSNKSFNLVTEDIDFDKYHKNSKYYSLEQFDYSKFYEVIGTKFNNFFTKEGIEFKTRSNEKFIFNEFNNSNNFNVAISYLYNSDKLKLMKRLFEKSLNNGKSLFLISLDNEFLDLSKKFNSKVFNLNEISFNLFSLYSKDNDIINNIIILSYSRIITTMIEFDPIDKNNYHINQKINNAVKLAFKEKKEKTKLVDVYRILKNQLDKEYLIEIEPFIEKDSTLYNLFNGEFNIETDKQLNYLKLNYSNGYFNAIFINAFFNSIILFKYINNINDKYIFALENLNESFISLNFLKNLNLLINISRKYYISFYLPISTTKKTFNLNFSSLDHIFLLRSNKKTFKNHFLFSREIVEKQCKIENFNEFIYINNNIPYSNLSYDIK